MERIRLAVQADDFGMCQAINRGVVEAFRHGILTQAVLMAPCPWFEEAVALAKQEGIPVGMHCTLTCEWDHMRWRPLTPGRSLVEADGTFHRTVESAQDKVVELEAIAELREQAARLIEHGLEPIYFDTHMGFVCNAAYRDVCSRYQRPFLFPVVKPYLDLTSFAVLSPRPADEKRAWLLEHLRTIGAGDHFLQTHPGEASEELRELVVRGSSVEPWAEEYRVSDLALLVDDEVKQLVAERGIELVTVQAFAETSRPFESRRFETA